MDQPRPQACPEGWRGSLLARGEMKKSRRRGMGRETGGMAALAQAWAWYAFSTCNPWVSART